MQIVSDFIVELQNSFDTNDFIKISFGNYQGNEPDLKNVYAKLVVIKKQTKISFTYRYKTKDIVKNYSYQEAVAIIEEFLQVKGFCNATLCSLKFDLTLNYAKEWHLEHKKASVTEIPTLEHDRQKVRKIESQGKKYLQELRITDSLGNVYKATQDKYKQINHYIELLSSLLRELPPRDTIHIVDMGSGKGYLTFALYDYLNNIINKKASIIGVEYRKDLVDLCNQIAQNSGFSHLQFVEGAIENYENQRESSNIDVLIALHACDTATDDAICKGIKNNADLIVVAPCCHKQIRRAIEKNNAENSLDFLTKYGVFLERQSEMVTDGIRALILEYFGYTTKVFEFISDAHTPKNVLIVGQKKQNPNQNLNINQQNIDKESILSKIRTTKTFFGIDYHHLEVLMGLDSVK